MQIPIHSTANTDFSTELVETGPLDPAIQRAWEGFLAISKSPEKVFQTPEYFAFISQNPVKSSSQELVVARNAHNQEIVAVLPLRTGRRSLPLNIGNFTFLYLHLRTVALLGSVPMGAASPEMLDALIDFIFKSFPSKNTIAMQSLPKDSDFYQYLRNSKSIRKKYGFFVKDGWRDCHTTPLPDSFETYLSHFKAKKRYNLNRQLKLLEKNSGPLELVRIDKPEHVPELVAAMKKLVSAQMLKSFLNENQFTDLARKKIKLGYILKCSGIPCAVIIGIQSKGTYHIHNILYDQDKAEYSPGTSILHLAIEDMIDNLKISLIDYGYGSPEHSHQSSNVHKLRGHVILYKKTWANRLMFSTYAAHSLLVDGAKSLLARVHPSSRLRQLKTPLPALISFTFL
ncbi:GNAT family N-acetyltransferase [Rhodoferax sp. WC2427]|uniref:GNAT family N-acetyltransferase n=1 Tax=Rhodoferax sp. WC2427 TaxID=3234144 RepID=UPI0034666609